MKRFSVVLAQIGTATRHAATGFAVLAGISAAIYLPIMLDHQANDQPAETPVAQHVAAPKPAAEHGERPWDIDFTSQPNGPLAHRYWNFESGTMVSDYNDELQAYSGSIHNLRVQDGTLVLEARQQAYDGKQFTSARINTLGKFDFTYGTLEVDMKLPAGVGSWPAAWLLPAQPAYTPQQFGIASTDPHAWALNGEIDFMEAVGYIPGQNIPAAHSYNEVQRAPTYTPGYVPDSATAFHRYGVIKTPTSITFTIDGVPYASRQKTSSNPLEWPYDQPYYLILDLAVGGQWAGAKGVDTSTAPWQLQVRSISYTPLD